MNYTKWFKRNFSIVYSLTMGFFVLLYVLYVLMFPNMIQVATIGILALTLMFNSIQLEATRANNDKVNDIKFRIKQFEELYMPLKTVSPNFEKLDVKEIAKYSYLASTELSKHIDNLIDYIKSPGDFTIQEKKKLLKNIEDAIENDTDTLKKDLNFHLI